MPDERLARRAGEPGLGPYRGPVVVLALIAAVVLGGVLIAAVGAVRAPDDVSNSATVLGTFPIDPGAEGIPAGPAGQPTDPVATSVPPDVGPVPPATSSSTPPPTTPPDVPAGVVLDAFDGDLAGWEPAVGDWSTAEGALVVPAGTDAAPAFLVRTDAATGIGGEVGTPARAAGLVVGFSAPGTYATALAVPALGGWRLEVVVSGAVTASASAPAPTTAGTQALLSLQDGDVVLVVGGAEVGRVTAGADLGDRVGFVGRGPAGGRWAAALEGPEA